MIWIVSYDIPNDQRRRKVAKLLEGYGRRAQYSVFECDLNVDKIDQLEQRLRSLLNDDEDDVRFYPLNKASLKRLRLLGIARLRRNHGYYVV